MWDNVSQIAIFILTTSALILVAEKNKWGFVCGFLSQPFWFITAIGNHQTGVLGVTIVSTFTWAYGIYLWFWGHEKRDRNKQRKEAEASR